MVFDLYKSNVQKNLMDIINNKFSIILLLFIKDFSPAWKWGYIGFIVLLAVITIFRIREAQKVWYQESDKDN